MVCYIAGSSNRQTSRWKWFRWKWVETNRSAKQVFAGKLLFWIFFWKVDIIMIIVFKNCNLYINTREFTAEEELLVMVKIHIIIQNEQIERNTPWKEGIKLYISWILSWYRKKKKFNLNVVSIGDTMLHRGSCTIQGRRHYPGVYVI